MVSIQATTEQILVNMRRNLFYLMKNEEVQNCMRINGHLICYQNQPLYTDKTMTNNCEFILLTHAEVTPESCPINITSIMNTWVQLHKPNNWVFVYPKERMIDIICNNNRIYTERLNGSGIIELGPNCMIKQTTIIISSQPIPRKNEGGIYTVSEPTRPVSKSWYEHVVKINGRISHSS